MASTVPVTGCPYMCVCVCVCVCVGVCVGVCVCVCVHVCTLYNCNIAVQLLAGIRDKETQAIDTEQQISPCTLASRENRLN